MNGNRILLGIALGLSGCTAILEGRQIDPECLVAADCPTGDVCAGPLACDPMTHTCVPGSSPLDCDDGEPCTTDSCDSGTQDGCVHALLDGDNDGYAPGTCTDSTTWNGGDCDDASTAVNPGVQEDCSTAVDDNCSGSTGDYPQNLTCYRDFDGDGFHDINDTTTAGCSCPTGYIQPNPVGPDCADGVASAKPGQTAWFDRPYCRSGNMTVESVVTSSAPYWGCPVGYYAVWDYNCVNGAEQYVSSAYSTCGNLFNFSSDGSQDKATVISSLSSLSTIIINYCFNRWDSATSGVPSCGDYGYMWTCSSGSCNANTTYTKQTCH